MSDLLLKIVTPEGKAFEGPIQSVVAPGVMGSFGVLPGHAPIISALEHGVVKVNHGGHQSTYVVQGGFLEVKDGQVVILVDRAREVEGIEEARRIVHEEALARPAEQHGADADKE